MDPPAAIKDEALGSLPLLSRALSYEGSLRARTEGITWSIWGIVLALIMFLYAAMGDVGDRPPPWTYWLWAPWLLVGGAVTLALWRGAALTLASVERTPAGLWVTLAWGAAIAASLSILSLDAWAPNAESLPVVALGIAWLLAGATNLFRASPEGRRALIAIGLGLLAAGVALTFLLPAPMGDDVMRFGQDVVRASVVAFFPLAVGLRQALRG